MVPRETLPADRCDHIDNRALLNKPCAKAKTVEDQAVIGHWRRVRQDSGQAKRRKANGGTRIKSRGFDKGVKKRMDGTVERRKALEPQS